MKRRLKRKFANQYARRFWKNGTRSAYLHDGIGVDIDADGNLIRRIKPLRPRMLQRMLSSLHYSRNISYDMSNQNYGGTLRVPVYLYAKNRKSPIQGIRVRDMGIGKTGLAFKYGVRMDRDDMFKTAKQLLCEVT